MEVLKGKARNIKKENSLKKKNIKGEYGRNRYHHMSEEKKQRLSKGIPKKLLQCKKKKKLIQFFFFLSFSLYKVQTMEPKTLILVKNIC